MFELIDNFVTDVLTFMIYTAPVCTGIAFIHFVVTHPAAQKGELAVSPKAAETQRPAEKISSVTNQPIKQPEIAIPELAELESSHAAIECAPIDWTAWRVRDLRASAMRTAFGINVRKNGRVCPKRELIVQYEQAIHSSASCLSSAA